MKLSTYAYTYNGKVHCPAPKVYGEGVLLSKSDGYNLTESSLTKLPGKYTVKAEGCNNFEGTVSAEYEIVIKPTKISSLTAKTKAFTVKASKCSSTYVTGYQLRYSTYSSMKNAKIVTIGTKPASVTKTVKNLKQGKKYYVEVRSYKKIDGKKYYSVWSAKKSVKTK